MAEKGTISINAENIMPVIKKWLYSDKDIFVREVVSNGCDAVSKMKRLLSMGEAKLAEGEGEDPWRIDVVANAEEGTLTFTDNGIGMTAEEVKKYIAQVAFSGAEEFLKKYKAEDGESGIIGHFGLGFYSVFMVSKKVVIDTMSYQEGAQAVRWIERGRHGVRPGGFRPHDARHVHHAVFERRGQGVCQPLDAAADAGKVLPVHARAHLRIGSESAQGGRGGEGSAQAGADQRHPSPVAEAPGGRQGRGVPRVLPQGVPRLRRAAVLDPLERRVSLQPQGHPLLPQAQK